jgi:hypothetical protein
MFDHQIPMGRKVSKAIEYCVLKRDAVYLDKH